jgi:hypothetical protein
MNTICGFSSGAGTVRPFGLCDDSGGRFQALVAKNQGAPSRNFGLFARQQRSDPLAVAGWAITGGNGAPAADVFVATLADTSQSSPELAIGLHRRSACLWCLYCGPKGTGTRTSQIAVRPIEIEVLLKPRLGVEDKNDHSINAMAASPDCELRALKLRRCDRRGRSGSRCGSVRQCSLPRAWL